MEALALKKLPHSGDRNLIAQYADKITHDRCVF